MKCQGCEGFDGKDEENTFNVFNGLLCGEGKSAFK